MTDDYAAAPDEEETGGGMLNHLPAVLIQRRWMIIIPFVVLAIAGVAAAFLLPTTYRSAATLLVESQELPVDLVGSPVTNLIDQRIAKIRQQVLSRGKLIELIQQNNLYPSERGDKPLSAIIEKMRENTLISAVSADIGQGAAPGKTNTIAFSMSFDYSDPVKAQLVMQSFVESFLELDAQQMAAQAGSTVEFLSDQASSLQRQIAQIEGQITNLKAQNGSVLARAGMPTVATSGSYDAQIAALQRENTVLEQQAKTQAAAPDPVVAQAEADLASAHALYNDNHPDVKLAERRLEAAKQISASQKRTGGTDVTSAAISANNAQIAQLGRLRSIEMAQSSSAIAAESRAPVVMEQVSQLESRAEGLRTQYRDVAGRLLNARSSARMESEQKGERLSVIDPPVVPDKPMSPNRTLLILGGIFGGLGAGVLLALVIETVLRPVRGVVEIERMLGVPPLVVIPTLRMGAESTGRFQAWWSRLRQRLRFRRRPRPAQ